MEKPEAESLGAQVEADVLRAWRALMEPLATLAVAHGLPYASAEEALKKAFVDVARRPLLEAGLPEHRLVSRISATTGINRREVTRLTMHADEPPARSSSASLLSEVFTRWKTDRALRDANGKPLVLPRTGPTPSFESLTRSITQDIHPRGVLDELCRVGVARHEQRDDTVHLMRETFVPGGDRQQMLGFLADNVGDHLKGAVRNLTDPAGKRHFDQAVFAGHLSDESLALVRQFVTAQWKRLLDEAVPLLEQRIEADRLASVPSNQRVRIGLYGYNETMPASEPHDMTNQETDL